MRKKRNIILENSTAAFLSEGYDASVERIAQESGVVRQTVYNLFKSKEGLFTAVIGGLIAETTPKDLLNFPREPDIRKALLKLGVNYLSLMLNPKVLQMFRVIVSQVSLDPGLSEQVFARSGGLLKKHLVNYLEDQARAGVVAMDDADMAAEQFLGMLLGNLHLRASHGLGGESARLMKRRAEAAVTAFLAAYAPANIKGE
jgi:TetR/AcrR family transcriptional regulator, mexJK operon transcriptional repressor